MSSNVTIAVDLAKIGSRGSSHGAGSAEPEERALGRGSLRRSGGTRLPDGSRTGHRVTADPPLSRSR